MSEEDNNEALEAALADSVAFSLLDEAMKINEVAI